MQREIKIWMWVLLTLYLVITFGVIQLMARLTPAIEQILQENVYSVTAVETMLCAAADPNYEDREARFTDALTKAKNNITESEEKEIIQTIEQNWHLAFAGDQQAMSAVVASLNRLGEVNRNSMQRADDQAKWLGNTGTWAMVMLGFTGFLMSLFVMRRLMRRFLDPLEEIHRVLLAFQQGERFRRCKLLFGSSEFQALGDTINQLLEMQWSQKDSDFRTGAYLDRVALLHVMDDNTKPVVVLNESGDVHATNKAIENLNKEESETFLSRLREAVNLGDRAELQDVHLTKLKGGGWIGMAL